MQAQPNSWAKDDLEQILVLVRAGSPNFQSGTLTTRPRCLLRISNIALNNIERAYANSVVNNDMDRIIDIFGRPNGRGSDFF